MITNWDDHVVFMLLIDVPGEQQLPDDGAEGALPEREVAQLGGARHEDVESGNVSLLQRFGGRPYHDGVAELKARQRCHPSGHLEQPDAADPLQGTHRSEL